MKIPEKLQVAGMTYTVEDVESDSIKLEYGVYNGAHFEQTLEIFLNKALNEQHKEQTFVHECVHAILDTLQVSNQEIRIDERFVESFSQILYQIIKQL